MIDQLSRRIQQVSNRKRLLILLGLFVVLIVGVNTLNLPFTVPRIKQYSGGVGILDAELFYRADHAYAVLAAEGVEGRRANLYLHLSVDLALPFIYPLFFAVAVSLAFRRSAPALSKLQKLNLLPLLAGVFDGLENIAMITMILKYPMRLGWLATLAGYMTLGKEILIGCSLLLLLLGGALRGAARTHEYKIR